MVEAEWGASPCVLEGLRGEGLIVAMDEAVKGEEALAGHRGCGVGTRSRHRAWGSLELAEDVGVFSRDAGRLQDGHTEGEGVAQA